MPDEVTSDLAEQHPEDASLDNNPTYRMAARYYPPVPQQPRSKLPYIVLGLLIAALSIFSGIVGTLLVLPKSPDNNIEAIRVAVQATVRAMPNAPATLTAFANTGNTRPTTSVSTSVPTSAGVASFGDEPSYVKQLTAYKEGYQGLAVYFVLADTNGAMVAADGAAHLIITEGSGQDTKTLYDQQFAIQKHFFVKTTVGTGAFEHELLLCSFGRIAYTDFTSLPTHYSGDVKLTFTTKSGKELVGQETMTFDLEPTPVPPPPNTSTPAVFVPGTHEPAPTVQGPSTSLFDVPEPVSYLTYFKDLAFIGVIKYNGDTLRGAPEIILTLSDDQGNVLSTQKAYTVPEYILPYSLVPFHITISDPPDKWAKLNIDVTADEVSDFLRGYIYTDVTLEGITTKSTSSGIKTVGRVKNTGTKTLERAEIIATIYDDKEQLVDVVSTYMIQDSVAPGASGTFELTSSQTKSARHIEFMVTGSPK